MSAPAKVPGGKIRKLRDLVDIAEAERARGGRVVLAHGTFDLLHIGHLRYLRQARALGTLLIVTLTADSYVNRGPGRPVFPEDMRAEMLAGLDCVDHVAVVHASLAVPAIEAVKPALYVKGAEYREADKDITGGITLEAGAVEANGGELAFIDDITFSSTSLINRHLGVHDPQLQRYLEGVAGRGTLNRLTEFAERIADSRVVILGDAILDEYIYVSPLGKSAKENIIATLHQSSELFAGGVFAAANHVAGLCREVDLITVVGAECPHMEHAGAQLKDNVTLHAIERPGTPTTRKTRFIDESYMRKLFEVYHMDDRPVSDDIEARVHAILKERLAGADLLIVTDFGHGLMGPELVRAVEDSGVFLAVNTQTNSANAGFNLITKYRRADYVCIDAPEARLATADRRRPVAELMSDVLPGRIDCPRFVVTHGHKGSYGLERGEEIAHAPAFTRSVVDTVGAGDAFFTVTAPFAAAGAAMEDLVFVGNAAGAIKVGIVGHRQSVEKVALMKYMTTLLK